MTPLLTKEETLSCCPWIYTVRCSRFVIEQCVNYSIWICQDTTQTTNRSVHVIMMIIEQQCSISWEMHRGWLVSCPVVAKKLANRLSICGIWSRTAFKLNFFVSNFKSGVRSLIIVIVTLDEISPRCFLCRHLCAIDIRVSKNRLPNWDLIKKEGHEFMGIILDTTCGFYDELFGIVIRLSIWHGNGWWWVF